MREVILNKIEAMNMESITDEERDYIFETPDLQLEVMEKFSHIKEYWTISDLFEYILGALTENHNLDKRLIEKYCYNAVIFSQIDYDEDTFEIIGKLFDENSLYKSKCLDYFYTQLEKEENLKNAKFNNKMLMHFTQEQKFDVISKINYVILFTSEDADSLLQNYPFSKYGMPPFINNLLFRQEYCYKCAENVAINMNGISRIINNLDLKYFDDTSLLNIFENGLHDYIDNDAIKKVIYELTNRMVNNLHDFNVYIKENSFIVSNLYYYISENLHEYNDILINLYNHNIFYFAKLNIEIGHITTDELINNLITNMNDDAFYTLVLGYNNDSLDKKIIDALIKEGKINHILEIYGRSIDKDILNKILTELENNNPNYDEDINNLSPLILREPFLLLAILKTRKIYDFSFLNHINYGLYPNLSREIKNYMINSDLDIIFPKKVYLPFILEVYITKGKDREVIEWFAKGDIFAVDTPIRNKIYEILIKNPEYINIILNSNNETKFAFLSPKILDICLSNNEFNKKSLLEYAIHNETCDYFFTKDICLRLKDFIVNEYQINENNYVYLVENIGPHILRFIDNENVLKLLKIDFLTLQKICNLFMEKEYTIKDLEAAYDSISQQKFIANNPNIINIFPNIIQYLENGVDNALPEGINFYIGDILNYLDEKFLNSFFEKYELPEGYNTPKDILEIVLMKIKLSNDSTKYKNILHEITDYYIKKKREEFRNSENMYKDMGLHFKYNKKSAIDSVMKYFFQNPNALTFYYIDGKTFYDRLLSYYMEHGYRFFTRDKNMILNAIFSNNNSLDSKKISEMRKLFKQFLECNWEKIHIENIVDNYYPIKRDYAFDYKYNDENIWTILTNIKIDTFISTVIDDADTYESLMDIMKKRKIHLLPSKINSYISREKLNLEFNFSNIASFISNYHNILATERKAKKSSKKITIPSIAKIIKNSIVYGCNLDYYGLILGAEDARYIKRNDPPNSATRKLSDNERLKRAADLTIKNFLRDTVTVPTFNEIFTTENKPMRIVVGNFTHPSNLTHGERTGACMRIGGAGESLFDFVLTNENGFHIRFEDPITHEYISRVSGFRNGNTVFLNELRYSLNPKKYSNKDVENFCKLAAMKIIELSKDSEFPIENVVIHDAYAMLHGGLPTSNLNVSNIKEGLPWFYSDVNNFAIVLATTAITSDYVPVVLKTTNLPKYIPAREQTFYTENPLDFINMTNRIHAINTIIKSKNPEYEISGLTFDDGFTEGYANIDWYAYLDSNGNIHSEIINIDSRAEIELSEAIKTLSNKKLNNI